MLLDLSSRSKQFIVGQCEYSPFSIYREAIGHFPLAAHFVAAVVMIYSGVERLSTFRTTCSSFGSVPRHWSSIDLGKITLSDVFSALSEFHVLSV